MDINDTSFKDKFSKDVLWNASSLIFLSISGLALNFLIALNYGAEFLGIFNIVFALYIVLSQFAVFGLHLLFCVSLPNCFQLIKNNLRSGLYRLSTSECNSFAITFAAWQIIRAFIFKDDDIISAYQLLLPTCLHFL